MEEAFFRTHTYLVEHTDAPVRRTLMDEIDWSDRLIGIKGTRGVGKSTFLLQYAKEHFGPTDRKCLYVNMNNFYFQSRGIADFAGDFVRHGGRTLLIDQVFKQSDWSKELRKCYDLYPELRIVFTGSSVMRLKEENPELNGIVKAIICEASLSESLSTCRLATVSSHIHSMKSCAITSTSSSRYCPR